MVKKNTIAKRELKAGSFARISGKITKTKLGHHFATSVTSTPFWVAKYPRVPKTAIAERSEIIVFQIATKDTAFTISDFSHFRAPYANIIHMATEIVKNICPAAADQVASSPSFDTSTLVIYSRPADAQGRVAHLIAKITIAMKGKVAVKSTVFQTDFALLKVKKYINITDINVPIKIENLKVPFSSTPPVMPKIFPKKKSLLPPAHAKLPLKREVTE